MTNRYTELTAIMRGEITHQQALKKILGFEPIINEISSDQRLKPASNKAMVRKANTVVRKKNSWT